MDVYYTSLDNQPINEKTTLSLYANMQLQMGDGNIPRLRGEIWVSTKKTCEKFEARLSMKYGIFILLRDGKQIVRVNVNDPLDPKDTIAKFACSIAHLLGGGWVINYKKASIGSWLRALLSSPLDVACPRELISV